MRTVSELAELARVSVRTLHHYDEIGLLTPRDRTDAGHRRYDDDDVRRLHEILTWRALGFPLDEIRALLDDPAHDTLEALRDHRGRLRAEHAALGDRLAALDEALARAERREPLSDADLRALFDGFDPAAHEAEVQERWGDTAAYAESKRRTARYGAAEWARLRDEQRALHEVLGALVRRGEPPDSAEARAAAEAHRALIDRWFYPVDAELHLGQARLYVEDPRFTATYEAVAPGLARWLHDAIVAHHAPRRKQL